MKQTLAGGVAILAVGLAIGFSFDVGQPAPPPDPMTSGRMEKVDLMPLWLAYHNNADAADRRYRGRLVEVTGPVLCVENQEGEARLFLFDLDLVNGFEARARCHFERTMFPELARLEKKAPITVRGRIVGQYASPVTGAMVVLTDCTLVGK